MPQPSAVIVHSFIEPTSKLITWSLRADVKVLFKCTFQKIYSSVKICTTSVGWKLKFCLWNIYRFPQKSRNIWREDWDHPSPGSSLRLNLAQVVAVLVHNEQITIKSWRMSVSISGGEGIDLRDMLACGCRTKNWPKPPTATVRQPCLFTNAAQNIKTCMEGYRSIWDSALSLVLCPNASIIHLH